MSRVSVEEQLFRSVEGQAASDEEEERWTGEQQRQVDEVKRILTRLSCCGDRSELHSTAVHSNSTHSWGAKNIKHCQFTKPLDLCSEALMCTNLIPKTAFKLFTYN